jgi:4-hydroxy-tetrahydrodipicolinate synthase/2-dehydro-3-deoxy-phosphogluconate/2-dehydro-3-deoxy-6-phosphogalactonate aldolase
VTAFAGAVGVADDARAPPAGFGVDGGCHGVFVLGTNGEFPLLTPQEQRGVVGAVADEVSSVPVLAGVGAPSTRGTVARATAAEDRGADGVVVVTPYYYPLDDTAVVEHYRRVAGAVDVPVYVYHIPSRTGNALSLSALDRIADVDGVAGLKDSSKDVPWLGQALDHNPGLTFLAGSDSLLYASLELGCAGLVSAVANVFPELVVDLYEAFDEGDEERARELQSTLYRVREAFKRGPYMAGVKTALSLRGVGFDVGGPRSPLRRMDDAGRERLEDQLRELGVL